MAVGESETRHINSAFFTFVLEDESAMPRRIKPQTPEEKRRYHNALARRRLQMDRNIIRQAGTDNSVWWSLKNANELILGNVMTLLSLHEQSRAWDRYQDSVC